MIIITNGRGKRLYEPKEALMAALRYLKKHPDFIKNACFDMDDVRNLLRRVCQTHRPVLSGHDKYGLPVQKQGDDGRCVYKWLEKPAVFRDLAQALQKAFRNLHKDGRLAGKQYQRWLEDAKPTVLRREK